MSVEELNFKKLSTEKYRIYRILQSPSAMVETYRKRIKSIGSYRGAVIFPEQFISLYGQTVCAVKVIKSNEGISASASVHHSFSLRGYGKQEALKTFDDVLEIEARCISSGDMDKMFMLALTRPVDTYYANSTIDLKWDEKSPTYWFSNKSDGLAFIRKNLSF